MNIEWVIPCRFVEVHDNLATIVGAGIDTFWVPEVPAPVQVVLAIRLLATMDEIGEGDSHSVLSRVYGPDGVAVGELTGSIEVSGTSARPEWLVGVTVGAVVGFTAASEGTYSLEYGIDTASVRLPIHVVLDAPS